MEELPTVSSNERVPPERRYNVPKIAWQLASWGWLLCIGFVLLLATFGPRAPVSPDEITWGQRATFFIANHPLAVAGAFTVAFALFVLGCELIVRRRRR